MERYNLTKGPVGKRLFFLTAPMALGIFSMMAFNLTDTFFVSRLGVKELAAMSFTFPAVFFIGSIAMGLGTAAASVISRAVGEGNRQKVKRLTTDSLVLSLIIVILLIVVGLATMKPVFTLLGAGPDIFALIKQYMTIWYSGVIFLVVPIIGNNAIRASGDTKLPGIIMMVAAGANLILDPLFIFGLFGFPKMGLAGAAAATVYSRAFSLVISLVILHFKKRMLDFSYPRIKALLSSWGNILYVGIPAAIINLFIPLSLAVIMKLAADYGPVAVAAVGVGIRIEAFALITVMALSTALVPFIGQNWGAGEFTRICLAQKYSNRFSFWWGALSAAALIIAAAPIGHIFSKDPLVVNKIISYLWIVPFGYGLRGIRMLSVSVFNAINKPIISTAISAIWIFALYIPFAYIGSNLFGLNGIFAGVTLANIIAGFVSFVWAAHVCPKQAVETAADEPVGEKSYEEALV